jgi:hypothetical protein
MRREILQSAPASRPAEGPESRRHSLAKCVGVEWKIPAPETWEAIRKAATTAGTLMNLRN